MDEEPPLVIELEGGTLLTIDVSGQSGNVMVGFGYITNSSGHPRFQVVFVVILFDEEGSIKDFELWDPDDLEPGGTDDERRSKAKKSADELVGVVGVENAQDLVSAVDNLRNELYDLANVNLSEMVAGAALTGAVGGAIGGPFGVKGGLIIGAASGVLSAIISYGEIDKWSDYDKFLSDLLIYGGLVPIE
jgi:hypothetical protein